MHLGLQCENDIEECASSPCLNQGNCSEPQPDMYQCACPSGITGTNCERVIFANFNGGDVFRSVNLPSFRQRRRKKDVTGALYSVKVSITTSVLHGIVLFATGV